MPVELNETSTHEDIQSAVDQIVQDKETTPEENAPEEKRDGQAVAEDQDEAIQNKPAEDDSGSTAKGEKPTKGEDTGEEGQPEWLDENLKAEATAFGIDEKDLAEFTSREELERAMRLFDRNALDAGRKAMAEKEKEGSDRDEHGRFAKKEPEAEAKEEPSKDTKSEGGYEVALDKEVYDEDLVNEFARMRDHYESRVAALESRFAEADAKAEEQRFDSLVDSLGHADLFGKSGKEKPKELERRQDLYVQAKAHQLGLEQLGRPAEMDESLINRVARMVFADELGKKDLKARTRKVSKQSNGRMGGSATKPHNATEPLRDEMRRLYKELEDG